MIEAETPAKATVTPTADRRIDQWATLIVVLLLVFIFAANCFIAYKNSITWDELGSIGGGEYITHTGQLNTSCLIYQPPLPFYLHNAFLTTVDFNDTAYAEGDCKETAKQMLFFSGINTRLIIFLARLPTIIIIVLLGYFVFALARKLFGGKSGILALFLYAFSTSMLAFSNLALADPIIAALIFITVFYAREYLEVGRQRDLILTGVLLGLSMLTKLPALILLPLLAIMFVYGRAGRKNARWQGKKKEIIESMRQLTLIFLIAGLVMYAGYLFSFQPLNSVMPEYYRERAAEEIEGRIQNGAVKSIITDALNNLPLPFPSYFSHLSYALFRSDKGIYDFFNGRIVQKSVWYSVPYVFAVKSQLALFVLLAVACIALLKSGRTAALRAFIYLLLPAGFILLFFMANHMTRGLRHIIGIYPFLFVFASRAIAFRVKPKERKWLALFLVLTCLYYALSFVLIYPHPIAYFNELVGGPSKGYLHLVDANLDLGQDLVYLQDFMAEHNIERVNLSYFGSVDPKEYGIAYDYMPSPFFQPWVPEYNYTERQQEKPEDCSERKGYVAISATNLQNVQFLNKSCYTWLDKYTPIEVIGYSIFVYNITSS